MSLGELGIDPYGAGVAELFKTIVYQYQHTWSPLLEFEGPVCQS